MVKASSAWPIAAQNRVDGSRCSFADEVFELGKDLFDRVQVGEYFGRKKSLAPTERMSWRTALLL